MSCELLLATAMLFAQRPDPTRPARPAPPAQTWPTAPPAANAPGSPGSGKPAEAAPDEQITTFDPGFAALDWSGGDWRVTVKGATLKDFGRREADAREALRLIRTLRLNQRGMIGGPTPVLEYWLIDGKPPVSLAPSLHTQPIDAATLRVERVQDQWLLRDAQRALFGFGGQEADAQLALAVLRKYGFTQIGALGAGAPSMMIFFAPPDAAGNAPPQPAPQPADPSSPLGKYLAQHPGADLAAAAPAFAPLREGAAADSRPSAASQNPDRTPFDWRQVKLRLEDGAWKLTAGSQTLADFGGDEQAARLGLSAMQYYHFTEQCRIGGPGGRFTYYLSVGQAPHGVMFGVDGQEFQSERLEVRQADGRWAVFAGPTPLVQMDDADAANQVLDLMRRQRCDRLCRLGTVDGKGMTFLVHSR